MPHSAECQKIISGTTISTLSRACEATTYRDVPRSASSTVWCRSRREMADRARSPRRAIVRRSVPSPIYFVRVTASTRNSSFGPSGSISSVETVKPLPGRCLTQLSNPTVVWSSGRNGCIESCATSSSRGSSRSASVRRGRPRAWSHDRTSRAPNARP